MLSPKLGPQLERMKRRSNSMKLRHRWKRKFIVLLLLVFCFATFLLLEPEYSKIKMMSLITPPLQKPKIAFLFIARNRIPLDIVWDAFFQVFTLAYHFWFITLIGTDLSQFIAFSVSLLVYRFQCQFVSLPLGVLLELRRYKLIFLICCLHR